jgi:hypothetical protein
MGKRTGVAYLGEIEMVLLPPIKTKGRDLMEILRETRAAVAAALGGGRAGDGEKGRRGDTE